MARNRSPVTRRQALAVGVGATIGSLMLPREWFQSSPDQTTQIDTRSWPMERHDPARTGYAPDANGPTEIPDVSWQATIIDEESGLNWLACSEETVYAATEHTLSAFTAARESDVGKRINLERFPGSKVHL